MSDSGGRPLDRFIPSPDIRERHEVTVSAPADLVFEVARGLDMQSLPLVRTIIWMRGAMLGAKAPPRERAIGFIEEMLGMGWGMLAESPGRLFVAGARCQPWQADVAFTPIAAERFASDATPDCVKIAWTLEAEPLGPERTRFVTETRAVANDEPSRMRFRQYWSFVRMGVVAIRLVMLPAIRREAERRWRDSHPPPIG